MILDFKENIILSSNTPLRDNTHSFWYLKEGLIMTYNMMNQLHSEKLKMCSLETNKGLVSPSFVFQGFINELDAQAVNLFSWYSINLINYVKCIGLILFFREHKIQPQELAGNNELKRKLKSIQSRYIASIDELKPVLHFRNKASAHPAFTEPYISNTDTDNSATLIESLSIIPTFENGRYFVGGITRQSGEDISTFSEHPWSLTDNFENLRVRFFNS